MTPKVTNKYTRLIKDYAGSIEISKDLMDDNMHGVWANDVRDFALTFSAICSQGQKVNFVNSVKVLLNRVIPSQAFAF